MWVNASLVLLFASLDNVQAEHLAWNAAVFSCTPPTRHRMLGGASPDWAALAHFSFLRTSCMQLELHIPWSQNVGYNCDAGVAGLEETRRELLISLCLRSPHRQVGGDGCSGKYQNHSKTTFGNYSRHVKSTCV